MKKNSIKDILKQNYFKMYEVRIVSDWIFPPTIVFVLCSIRIVCYRGVKVIIIKKVLFGHLDWYIRLNMPVISRICCLFLAINGIIYYDTFNSSLRPKKMFNKKLAHSFSFEATSLFLCKLHEIVILRQLVQWTGFCYKQL